MKAGELFAGYGGLALAVEAVFGAQTAWVAEWDEAPSKILAHHWPKTPNHRDVTTVDWANIEQVQIISGGSPCQDISAAGARRGMTEGTRSNLWVAMREAIAIQQPELVVWENVKGAFSAKATSDMEPCQGCMGGGATQHSLRALGRVLGDLSTLGYDAQWRTVRASDIGAPHQRARIFILAWRRDTYTFSQRRQQGGKEPLQGTQLAGNTQRLGRSGQTGAPSNKGWSDVELFPTPKASDGTMGLPRTSGRPPERSTHLATRIAYGTPSGVAGRLLPTPNTMDSLDWREGEAREKAKQRGMPNAPKRYSTGNLREEVHFNFGEYEPAIERWEKISQRSAPEPVQPSATGRPQLAPAFSEWLMGLPDGWVTSPEIGLTRAQQLKALGNGVVPQQAASALSEMWSHLEETPRQKG